MRIALIRPSGVPVSRGAGGSDAVLERLVASLRTAGHEVWLSPPGAGPCDLYVTLVCDADGNVTAATVSPDEGTILRQAG